MSYTSLLYHIIFRPKHSIPVIPVEHEKNLYSYIWEFIKNKNGILYRIGGMPDHIHLLVQLPPTLALSDFMHDLKLATHRYMREEKEKFPLFEGWGKSYCALSCSKESQEKIINYIKNQKVHHQTKNFHEELTKLLKDAEDEVNERYIFCD